MLLRTNMVNYARVMKWDRHGFLWVSRGFIFATGKYAVVWG